MHVNEYDYRFTVRYLVAYVLLVIDWRYYIVWEFVAVQSLSSMQSIVWSTKTPRRVNEMALRQSENNKNVQQGNEASFSCTAVVMRAVSLGTF